MCCNKETNDNFRTDKYNSNKQHSLAVLDKDKKKKDKGRISGLKEGTTKLTHSEQHRKNSEKIK